MRVPTFEEMRAFLTEHYKHDRLYGRTWPGESDTYYGDIVVRSAITYITEHGLGVIGHFEAKRGEAYWYEFLDGCFVEIPVERVRNRLRDAARFVTGKKLVTEYRANHPDRRFALHRDASMIATWSEELARWVAVTHATITGQWVVMDYEIKVNGELPYTDADFIEVKEATT